MVDRPNRIQHRPLRPLYLISAYLIVGSCRTTSANINSNRSLSNSHAQASTSNPMHSPTAIMGPTSAPTTPGNKRVSP